jgi:hypothetical protein
MGLFNHPSAQRAEKPDSTPIRGARRYIYNAGTDILTPIFGDPHLTYSVANPTISDGNGDFAPSYLLAGTYRVVIADRFERILLDEDGVIVDEEIGTTTVTTVEGGGAANFASIPALAADDTLAYAEAEGVTQIAPGDTLWVTTPGCGYEVADDAASDHDIETSGGVKLYALADGAGAVTTAQLGWTSGMDCTDALLWFMANHKPGTRVLKFTDTYRIRGAGYTIPDTLRAFVSDDYETLMHGEQATRGLLLMDASPESATANGLEYETGELFRVPSDFSVGGLFFDHDQDVDPDAIPNGGNKGGIFECADRAAGIKVDKCRFQFSGGKGINVVNSPYWKFTNNFAGKQKYLFQITAACDHGLYEGNRGEMGLGGNFGDYIKTTPVDNVGPRYCTVRRNYFKNSVRDGPDGTGGFHGWTFENNVFDVPIAAIDIKKAFRAPSDFDKEEDLYRGIRIVNNVFIGCGMVYTFTWKAADLGEAHNLDEYGLDSIYCSGNVYLGKIGKNTVGHLLKGATEVISDGEMFLPIKTEYAGDWDASTEAFPSGAVYGTHYVVSVDGNVAGQNFNAGDTVRPLADGAATNDAEAWHRDGAGSEWCGVMPFNGGSYGADDTWDPETNAFPLTGTGIGHRFEVTRDGVVGGVSFVKGDLLVQAAPTDTAGLESTYAGNWLRLDQDMNFSARNMVWDGRGVSAGNWLGHGVEVHFLNATFASMQLGSQARNWRISGRLEDVSFTLADCRDIEFDIRSIKTPGLSGRHFRITGEATDIWFDGEIEGGNEFINVSGAGHANGVHLGKRTGLRLRDVARVFDNNGMASVYVGEMDHGKADLWSDEPDHHNLGRLRDGLGPVTPLGSGTLLATHAITVTDTQNAAASDTLDTIVGGATADRLVLSIASAARTVVVTGTGNILVPEDLTLTDPAEEVTLERRADGTWKRIFDNGYGGACILTGGTIRIRSGHHTVDTEGGAATDDFDTIDGGLTGDVVRLRAADPGRVVTARDGTGNLVLGADRPLDDAGDVLVLEKRGDGMWHEVRFNG